MTPSSNYQLSDSLFDNIIETATVVLYISEHGEYYTMANAEVLYDSDAKIDTSSKIC